jgi:hypothetical protein
MVCVDEKTRLVDELSTLVQRHFPDSIWRAVLRGGGGSAAFGSTQRTLVAVECPQQGPFRRDAVLSTLQRLARKHGGLVDPCADQFALVSFREAPAALRLAVELQRLVPRARLRMGLGDGRCRMALCKAEGSEFLVLLGEARERMQSLAENAAPGTLQFTPQAYAPLRDLITSDLGSCLVLEAYDGEQLTEVSLTLPPDATADVSTFAGLGLS